MRDMVEERQVKVLWGSKCEILSSMYLHCGHSDSEWLQVSLFAWLCHSYLASKSNYLSIYLCVSSHVIMYAHIRPTSSDLV